LMPNKLIAEPHTTYTRAATKPIFAPVFLMMPSTLATLFVSVE
jgi:hypothetical protein